MKRIAQWVAAIALRLTRAGRYKLRLQAAYSNVEWHQREAASVRRDLVRARARLRAVQAERVNVDYPAPRGCARWTA